MNRCFFFFYLFTAVRPQAHIQKAVNKNGAAMAALGHASHDLSLRCRQAIRPLLQHSLSAHCSDSQTIAQCLFGDNLAQSIKDLKEMDRIGSAVAASSGNQTSLKHNNPRSNSGFGHPVKKQAFLRLSFLGTAVEPQQEEARGTEPVSGREHAPLQSDFQTAVDLVNVSHFYNMVPLLQTTKI